MQHAKAVDPEPDFRHAGVWIFDLDNTLYPADSGLFAQIEARMTLYVQTLLGLDADDARRLRQTYYREHGTTMNGLMRVHDVNPDDYLAFVHDIDLSALEHDAALAGALARLPGRRFVFTNGCRHHAGRVLERLGITNLFEDLWDIRTIEFCPKLDPNSYRTVLARAAASAAQSAMFDDIARNLAPAHALGLTTIWLRNNPAWTGTGFANATHEHIHYEATDLCAFLETLRI
jgi:putative hydrolase of the HAD superfamily